MQQLEQTVFTGTITKEAIAGVCEVLAIDPTSVTYIEIDGSTFYALAEHSAEGTTK